MSRSARLLILLIVLGVLGGGPLAADVPTLCHRAAAAFGYDAGTVSACGYDDRAGHVGTSLCTVGSRPRATTVPWRCDASLSFRQEFTGKERDAETGLDYFGARYFSGAQGRFTSPDEPLFDQFPGDPQSWNLYAYGRNNPLRYLDPTGRKCITLDNGSKADDGTGGGCAAAGVDASGSIQAQQVNVTAQQGSLLAAIGLGTFIGVSNAANDYFAWMFSSRPATLENTDPGNNRVTTTAAMIGPFLIPGPKGGQSTKLLSVGRARPILSQEALEHIVLRHWATSDATGAGKFVPGTTARALRGLIEEAVEGGVSWANTRGRAGSIVEYDFGRQVGTDVSGQAATRIRVVLNPDNTVRTAFPIR